MSHETRIESSWEFSQVDKELKLHRQYWKNVLQVKDKELQTAKKTNKELVYLVRAKNEVIAKLKSTQSPR